MKDEYPKPENKLNLEKDFPVPSPQEWRAIVESELKGVPFEKKLITRTYEGLDLKPIYTLEDTDSLKISEFPGSGDLRRGFKHSGYIKENWLITVESSSPLSEDANKELLEGLNSGASAISLIPDSVTRSGRDADYGKTGETGADGISLSGYSSVKRLLNGISSDVPLFINCGYNCIPVLSLIGTLRSGSAKSGNTYKGSIESDPLSWLAASGTMPVSMDTSLGFMKCAVIWAKDNMPGLKTTGIDTIPYHKAGANAVQELAIATASAVYYINGLIDLGISPIDSLASMRFSFASGNNFFMELAKFRAFRILLRNLYDAYDVDPSEALPFVSAKTSDFYYSRYDVHNNILRATTQALAAVLGGVDSLTVIPFDSVSGSNSELGRRIAKNLQVILNEEAKISRVIDFAGGSYYVESLTNEIAQKSWNLFREYESDGGIYQRIVTGKLQNEIAEMMKLRVADAAKRKLSIIGTNIYSNTKESVNSPFVPDLDKIYKKRADYLKIFRLAGDTEKHKSVIKKLEKLSSADGSALISTAIEAASEGATLGEINRHLISGKYSELLVKPLLIRRLPEDFEKLRDRITAHIASGNAAPSVYLINYGTIKTYKPRADFSKGFFETGGFNVIYPDGLTDISRLAVDASASEAPVLVLCSTDEEYQQIIPLMLPLLKTSAPAKTIVLAGYPKDKVEEYKTAGIDEFIYMGCDAVTILSALMDKSGVAKYE